LIDVSYVTRLLLLLLFVTRYAAAPTPSATMPRDFSRHAMLRHAA